MDCTGVKEKLIDLAYGELDPAEDRAAREHCARCPDCAKGLAELTETLTLARQAPEPELPPFLNARVMAHAREQAAMKKKPISRWAWIFRPQAAMAAVAMIAASVVIVVAVERGLGPEPRLYNLPEETAARRAEDQPGDAELKGRADWMAGATVPSAPAESAAPSAMAEGFDNQDENVAVAPTASEVVAGAPAPQSAAEQPRRRQAESDELRRERVAADGQAEEERLAFTADSMRDSAAPEAPAPVAAPPLAPASAPADNQAAGPSADSSRSGGGILGLRAKSVAPAGAGSLAPAPSAPATASAPAPAPSAPAEDRAVFKSMELEDAAPAEMKDEVPAKPDPQSLIASARTLEQQKKWAEALAAYQKAAAALGYVAGNEKTTPCSPALKEALEGARRCQLKLGKLSAARATAKTIASICQPETK